MAHRNSHSERIDLRTLARLTVALFATALVGVGVAAAPAYAYDSQARGTFHYATTLGGAQRIENPVIGVCYPTLSGPGLSFANYTDVPVTLFRSPSCNLTALGPYPPGQEGNALFLSARFG